MPATLAALEAQILAAHAAAAHADCLAGVLIRISLRKLLAVDRALADARELVPVEQRPAWIEGLGLQRHEAASLFRERKRAANRTPRTEIPPEYREISTKPSAVARLLGELSAAIDNADAARLAVIAQRASQIRLAFWNVSGAIREQALSAQLEASSRLGQLKGLPLTPRLPA